MVRLFVGPPSPLRNRFNRVTMNCNVCPISYLFPMVNGLAVLPSQVFVAGRLGNLSSSFVLIFLELSPNLIAEGGISRPEFVISGQKLHLKHPSRPLCFCSKYFGKKRVKGTLLAARTRPQ